MYMDEDYYETLGRIFSKDDEYSSYGNHQSTKKKSETEVYHMFEVAIRHRLSYKFSDYCREGKYYKYIDGIDKAYEWMVQQFPYKHRYSYRWMMKHWKDSFAYIKSSSDWALQDQHRWFIEKFIDEELVPNAEKYYANKAKAEFVLDKFIKKPTNNEPIKEEPVIVQAIIEEKVSNGKGRPKGSKNKKQEEMKPFLQ